MKNKANKKWKVSFLDKNRIKADVELNITYRNGYKEFTMSAHYNSHLGQCQQHIIPANEFQKALLALDKYHLNGMSAGTEEQNAIVNKMKKYDYDKAVALLKKKRKYTVKHPKTGKTYKYGNGWIKLDLPRNIEKTIQSAIDGINSIEDKRKNFKSELLQENIEQCTDTTNISLKDMEDQCLIDFILARNTSFDSVNEDQAERIAAFVKMFDLSEDDLQDIVINDTNVHIQGIDYIAGTDDEMEEEYDKELDSYIDECVFPGGNNSNTTLERYFDREAFKRDARIDGRAHSLNRYDGGEEYATINGTAYYAYRQ